MFIVFINKIDKVLLFHNPENENFFPWVFTVFKYMQYCVFMLNEHEVFLK